MMANDKHRKKRDSYQKPLPAAFLNAFKKIDADENKELIVIEDENHEIIGTLQLTFIQYLNYCGGRRAQIESVMIRKDKRGLGIGSTKFEWEIDRAKEKNVRMLQ